MRRFFLDVFWGLGGVFGGAGPVEKNIKFLVALWKEAAKVSRSQKKAVSAGIGGPLQLVESVKIATNCDYEETD